MKFYIIAAICVLFSVSCSSKKDNNRTDLLTAKPWTTGATDPAGKSLFVFASGGKYQESVSFISTEGKNETIAFEGTWKWLSDDQISVSRTSINVQGTKETTAKITESIIRVTDLTENHLAGIAKLANAAEESLLDADKIDYIQAN
jgi:hypothetical protein